MRGTSAWGSWDGLDARDGWIEGLMYVIHVKNAWDGCLGWMGWDGMGWDGMGWDGMGWDGMGWGGVE